MTAAASRQDRVAFFAMLTDGEHWLELRCRRSDGRWPKQWAETPEQADELAHASAIAGHDVYVGVLPRVGREGETQRRYAAARVLWADVDSERGARKLELFEPQPTALVLSGGRTAGTPHAHAYWRLAAPLPTEHVRRHALRLAHHLEADTSSTDAARVLRVPGSRSHKTGRLATLEQFTGEAHTLEELTGDLPDVRADLHENVAAARGPARTVAVGERHESLVSLLGCMRHWGAAEPVLVAAARAFCEHQCATDPAVPLDLERAVRTAQDVARRYPAGPARSWRQR